MVKADPKRNYYADLLLAPSATTDEIKQQFRKLARLYHPDRNPGKEIEYVPKFQAIQAAHEILGDPDQRAKYDSDRRRLGYNLGSRTSAQRPHFDYRHTTRPSSQYESFFPNEPPPPAPQPPRQSYYSNYRPPGGYNGQSAYEASGRHSSTRFTNYRPGPPTAGTQNRVDPEARSKAWQSWAPSTASGPQPQTPEPERYPRPEYHSASAKASRAQPGLSRSNTTRTPRKTGFDPNLPGDMWEPAAPKTSSYVFAKPRSSSMDHIDGADSTVPTSKGSSSRARSVSPKNRAKTGSKRAGFELPTTSSASDYDSSSSSSGVHLTESAPSLPPRPAQASNVPKRSTRSSKAFTNAWKEKFKDPEVFAAPPTSNSRRSSKSRASPSRLGSKPVTNATASTSRPILKSQAGGQTQETPRPANFQEDEWKQKFKDPSSFLFTPNTTAAQGTRASSISNRGNMRTRSNSRSNETIDSKSQNIDGPAPESTVREEPPDVRADSDAMDLDTPPKVPSPANRPPRMVKVPVSRSEWRDAKPVTSNPSNVPLSHNNMPSAVPNATPPPPPPPPLATQQAAATTVGGSAAASQPTFQQPPSVIRSEGPIPQSLNLSSLKDNLSSSGPGISSIGDIGTSLPFASGASSQHPRSTLSNISPSAPLEVPRPPAYPQPPSSTRKLTPVQWKQYSAQMSAYMGLWFRFEGQMLQHFAARHAEASKFGTGVPSPSGTRLIEAQGEPEGGGLGAYLEGRKKDRRIRERWLLASERHELGVEEFLRMKARLKNEGFAAE